MCGIAGYLNLNREPAQQEILEKMVSQLVHRGPDGSGNFVDSEVAIGHRRLAILDLSELASQPMVSANGRWVLSYNGEIYNFRELRKDLENLGAVFKSLSDTEVVLNALIYWGDEAFCRFNGMFALALWDRKEHELTLARDRYGIKPLYYTRDENRIVFGSEIKALLAHPNVQAELNRQGLLEYLTFQNFFEDRTLFKNISILSAGSVLKVSPGKSTRIFKYWDFNFTEPENPAKYEEYEEELYRLFKQAVRRQEVSDVPIGSYLSGGIDTGSITAIASQDIPGLPTFTVGFDVSTASAMEQGFDERPAAEHMSYLFQTEQYEMVLKSGDMERVLPDVVWHLEEPRVGQCYPNFYAAKLAKGFCTVVLSGTGGDEIFGGYPWRYYKPNGPVDFDQFIDGYYTYWQRLIPNKQIKEVFSPIWNDVSDVWTRDLFRDVFPSSGSSRGRPEDFVNECLYFESKTFLHGLLAVEDRLSMAHGLESRVPFLDNDLVDFATKLPMMCKLRENGPSIRIDENDLKRKALERDFHQKNGKPLLRDAMMRHLPKSVADAPKQGFSAPDASWFRREGEEYIRSAFLESDARIYSYLDKDAVTGLISEHLSGAQNRRLLIWSFTYLETWIETFLDL